MNIGQIAYNAYCKSTNNKSLISGTELPPFYSLDPKIKSAWREAALAVHFHTLIEYNDPGRDCDQEIKTEEGNK